jgi:hypothetical protein
VKVEDGGQFTLGGRNQSLYDTDVTFIPLVQESGWIIPLQAVIANSNTTISISSNSTGAVVDSGTKLIYGPDDLVNNFFAGVPAAQKGENLNPALQGYWVLREFRFNQPNSWRFIHSISQLVQLS